MLRFTVPWWVENGNGLIGAWGARLRVVAARVLAGSVVADPDAGVGARRAFVAGFRDELGHRARVVTPFLSALLGVDPDGIDGPPPPHSAHPVGAGALGPGAPGADGGGRGRRLDLDDRLWWAVHEPWSPVAEYGAGVGPLDPGLAEIAIESRTETELSAMHALFRLGLDRGEAGMVERALDAARWQVAELQPDNGTNHPWGIHVFVSLAAREADAEVAGAALMHAQMLLHNCQVQQGRPDRLSACILWDAAATLGRLAPA